MAVAGSDVGKLDRVDYPFCILGYHGLRVGYAELKTEKRSLLSRGGFFLIDRTMW